MTNRFEWWERAISGDKRPVTTEPECGYFKLRDRRGLNKNKAPIKRPWVACAIWFEDGVFKAELAGVAADVERLWPYCAKYPISYADYEFWHLNELFPEEISI